MLQDKALCAAANKLLWTPSQANITSLIEHAGVVSRAHRLACSPAKVCKEGNSHVAAVIARMTSTPNVVLCACHQASLCLLIHMCIYERLTAQSCKLLRMVLRCLIPCLGSVECLCSQLPAWRFGVLGGSYIAKSRAAVVERLHHRRHFRV